MITAIHRLTMQSHMSYSSCSCFCLLDRTIQICVSCFRAVKIWCFEYNSLILTTGCSTWHLMAKNSLRIWELELLKKKKQMHECCQHCFRGCISGRSACQCSDHTSHTATSRFAWPSSQKEASSEAGSRKSLQTVCWRQPGQEHELLEPCPVVWWV